MFVILLYLHPNTLVHRFRFITIANMVVLTNPLNIIASPFVIYMIIQFSFATMTLVIHITTKITTATLMFRHINTIRTAITTSYMEISFTTRTSVLPAIIDPCRTTSTIHGLLTNSIINSQCHHHIQPLLFMDCFYVHHLSLPFFTYLQ